MINQNTSLAKNALNLGAISGVLISVIQLIIFSFGLGEASGVGWLPVIIMSLAATWGCRKYREDVNNGYIDFGQCFAFNFLMVVGASIIFGAFMFIYIGFIRVEMIPEMLEQTEIGMYEQGQPDATIEQTMDIMRKVLSPTTIAVAIAMIYIFIGLIISLITSLFLKRSKSPFED